MKRTYFFILILLLNFSAAFGTPKKKEGKISKIKPSAPVTIKVLVSAENGECDSFNLEDYFNIHTDFTPETLRSKFNATLQVVSSGPADIVIFPVGVAEYVQACTQGQLADLEENKLLELWGPYLKSQRKASIMKNRFIDSPDRRLHGYTVLPTNAALYDQPYVWKFSSEVYQKAETPKVFTLSDFIEVINQALNPAVVPEEGDAAVEKSEESPAPTPAPAELPPREATNYPYDLNYVADYVAAYYGFQLFGPGFYDPATGNYIDMLSFEGPFLSVLKFFNSLAQQDIFAGDYLAVTKTQAEKSPVEMTEVIPKNAKILALRKNKYGGNFIWSVSADSQFKELSVAILNWFAINESSEPEPDLNQYVVCQESLYVPAAMEAELQEKWQELLPLIQASVPKIANAKDVPDYEQEVANFSNEARKSGYDDCVTFYRKQAENRYISDQIAKGSE